VPAVTWLAFRVPCQSSFLIAAWLRPVFAGEEFLGHGGKQLMADPVEDLGADFVFRARRVFFQTWRRVDPSDGEPSMGPDWFVVRLSCAQSLILSSYSLRLRAVASAAAVSASSSSSSSSSKSSSSEMWESSQNPRSNFAKSATLEWGTLEWGTLKIRPSRLPGSVLLGHVVSRVA
jgi:hypothetical protein